MSIPVIHVPGIGPKTAESLAENGINTVSALIGAGVGGLVRVPGISEAKAEAFIEAARALQGDSQNRNTVEPEQSATTEAAAQEVREEKKDTKESSDKKSKKNKSKKDKRKKDKKRKKDRKKNKKKDKKK